MGRASFETREMTKHRKVQIDPSLIVRIVANGSIAGQVRDGANLPVLVVDTTNVPAIDHAIRVAQYEPDGDVRVTWGTARKTKTPLLHVEMLRPVPVEFVVAFEMPEQAILIDAMLEARAFYLKAGQIGDTFKSTFAAPTIIIDVHPSDFNATWPSRYVRILMDEFRRTGTPFREARIAAEAAYAHVRRMTTLRVPQLPSGADDPPTQPN